jgi:1-deoxy-D-xylulose-5-phosphate reductoisomerase
MSREKIVILGSTGSIGCNALEVIRKFPDKFEVYALVAGKNKALLSEQVKEFSPKIALLAEDVGVAALLPTEAAIDSGKKVLLANKESLVCAGEILSAKAGHSGAQIVPVDSEHSAIFQLLSHENRKDLNKVTLTASGGPFLRTAKEEFAKITPAMAVKHPKWSMGRKISVDSATLMNKALEVIEARWLFDLAPEKITVIVHPQSIIHSLVEFCDGAQFAHLSVPDMKGAIAYALAYPKERLPKVMQPLDLAALKTLSFEEVDSERFPAVQLAYKCLKIGGAAPCVLNLANEAAVGRFLAGNLSFDKITTVVEETLEQFSSSSLSAIKDIFDLKQRIWEKLSWNG